MYSRRMYQTATYWAPGAVDGFGNVAFSAPATMLVRWENKNELFIGPQGREETSSAVVYVSESVENQGFLYLGTSAALDPREVEEAREIRGKAVSPNLTNTQTIVKVWL